MIFQQAHQALAFPLLLDQSVLGIWALVLGFRRTPLTGAFYSAAVVDEGLLVLQAVLGMFLFASGHTLKSPLHFLYGALLLGLLPVMYVQGNRQPARAGLWLGFTLLFMAGLIVRTYNTG